MKLNHSQNTNGHVHAVLLYKVCMCFLYMCMYTDPLTTCAAELNPGSPRFIKWELENFEASKR